MTKKERIVVFSTGAVFMVFFTFTDLAISTAIYSKNLFGQIFEVVGEVPFALLAVFAAALLFRFRSKKHLAANIAQGILFILLMVLFSTLGGFMTWNYLHENLAETPAPVAVLIAAFLFFAALLAAQQVPKERSREAVTFALIPLLYFVLVIVTMNSLKFLWGRMRIRDMTDPLTEFTRWYIIAPRESFDNAYASFPSGHAMNSAAYILLCLLPSFVPKLAGRERGLKIFALAWTLVVCFTRVMMGAHFASDVTAGVMLSLLLFELLRWALCKKMKVKLPEVTS